MVLGLATILALFKHLSPLLILQPPPFWGLFIAQTGPLTSLFFIAIES